MALILMTILKNQIEIFETAEWWDNWHSAKFGVKNGLIAKRSVQKVESMPKDRCKKCRIQRKYKKPDQRSWMHLISATILSKTGYSQNRQGIGIIRCLIYCLKSELNKRLYWYICHDGETLFKKYWQSSYFRVIIV